MKTEPIVALDVPNKSALIQAFSRLPAEANWYKIGLELFCAEGPGILEPLQQAGKNIFLDLKLHDIPRTVEKAVQSVIPHHVQLLTLHASGGRHMLKAAADAAKSSSLKLLAVTVLTSLDAADLSDLSITRSPADQARALAELAYACGVHGVVCSVHEAQKIREALGPDALIVTPGIRMPGDSAGDQKRIATPRDAKNAGASHIVVGRPVLDASDPAAVYRLICDALR